MSHKDISAYQKLLFNSNPSKMAEVISLEKVVELVKKLSLPDQIHLIELVLPEIRSSLAPIEHQPRKSLRGIWRDVDLTLEEMSAVRQELWAGFPRGDI